MLKKFFTEEGRTRLKNARRRYAAYALVWLAAGLLAAVGTYIVYVRRNLTPMQRVYYPQYAMSAWRSALRPALPLVSKSDYLVLVRETYDPETKRPQLFAVTEEEAVALLDARGYVKLSRDGLPLFALREGVERRRVFWKRSFDSDARRYEFFREAFFEGQGFAGMHAPLLFAALGVFACGLGGTGLADILQNRRYLRGELVRGPRRMTPKEYARRFRRPSGLGIRVRPAE
jgi:hypothetical protein